jgi:hypothetical protein
MNANNITEITIRMSDDTTKRIPVENGMILVLMGSGPMDGAFWTKLEQATEAELNAAEGEIIEEPIPFEDKLAAANEELQNSSEYSYFNSAVEFLIDHNAGEFLSFVAYAEAHNNRFSKLIPELKECVNADDCYCSAIIALARPRGKDIESFAFTLMNKCLADVDGAFEQFNWLWEELKKTN